MECDVKGTLKTLSSSILFLQITSTSTSSLPYQHLNNVSEILEFCRKKSLKSFPVRSVSGRFFAKPCFSVKFPKRGSLTLPAQLVFLRSSTILCCIVSRTYADIKMPALSASFCMLAGLRKHFRRVPPRERGQVRGFQATAGALRSGWHWGLPPHYVGVKDSCMRGERDNGKGLAQALTMTQMLWMIRDERRGRVWNRWVRLWE